MSVPTPTTIDGLPTLTINALNVANSIDPANDYLPIYQNSSTSTLGISRNTYLNLSSQPLGLTDTQSPTNKTFNNTNTITVKDGSFTIQNTSDTTKQAVFSLAGLTTSTTRTYTMPNYSATLASLAGSETLTNKTLTSPTINAPSITNASITADAITGYTSADTGTIYGMSVTGGTIGSAALATGAVTSTAIAAGAVQPQALISGTGTTWVWQSWTPTFTNFTQGNATISAVYIQMGKITFYQISIKLGSSSSMGTNPIFSLPTTAAGTYANGPSVTIGSGGMALGVSDAVILARAQLSSSTSADIIYESGAENVSYTQYAPVEYGGPTSTIPFTWTTGSCIDLSGFYQNT